MFHYTVTAEKDLEAAIKALEESLKTEKFGVLWDFDINEKLEGKGLNLSDNFRVLEVCNPEEAHKVLSINPLVSYFLPCKIVVYKEGESVKIGMPLPTSLISMVEDDQLKEIAQSIESRLIQCINSSL
jgi:uncharacterized protein (DUF302 family)